MNTLQLITTESIETFEEEQDIPVIRQQVLDTWEQAGITVLAYATPHNYVWCADVDGDVQTLIMALNKKDSP